MPGDKDCLFCKDPKNEWGACEGCPFDPSDPVKGVEAAFGFEVTPEMFAFVSRLFKLSKEAECFGAPRRPVTRLDARGLMVLHEERAKLNADRHWNYGDRKN